MIKIDFITSLKEMPLCCTRCPFYEIKHPVHIHCQITGEIFIDMNKQKEYVNIRMGRGRYCPLKEI